MISVGEALAKVRERKPLVHNITNFVVMNTTANALLALGASPVMAHAEEELEEMVRIADSVVVNIGTLDKFWINSMIKAAKLAKEYGKPLVLDPVGAGATRLRTKTALEVLKIGATIVKGNFGEISALLGEEGKTRGVDSSTYDPERAKELALAVAEEFSTIVAVTGKVDYVSDGKRVYAVYNGHELLGRVTGTGCIVAALTGAFVAVNDPLTSAVSSLVVFEVAAEKAAEEAKAPGTFHAKLYDWLYLLTPEDVERLKKIEVVKV
ncbi:hydroxyethylthiazole kinase [Pyrococcus furiosus DSM 3638]|uniref:Hydroxyethylthiazole kinase n=3 Tax=Pyrococcus furiosus TaxID=2261 RepID=THIM_PYRFU|nr:MULTISPECIES: hydroxyethylthiazole kinase [Pyrococcus]Q8U191.1 RecName: Full=Hydroxyethylthiazole kinase; AltName: Full=4-methyl-5-beta-hydroxyethylthiazole kinase; Short=TH kinase; Short=Thz kinase [Pyrococcus furiosus DSM 3638]AAL81459.1 hydroxyethylthiazole kinase [Pyrococcus furiosus DSM 3638]AFN04115.1 hydroxyethylthiazole kinase [Pyrococcus furiosus COM1]MDK2870341.1 hydroxyethylthiazole kinase [Pyrococcus sp.]QEK78970.1 hydroxyethylthiazole kinase [Pyrococcus furiosus DSM 3638]